MPPAALIGELGRSLSGGDFGSSVDKAGGIGTNLLAQGSAPPIPLFSAVDAKIRFQHRGDRAMCVHDGRGHQTSAREGDFHLNTEPNSAPEVSVRRSGKSVAPTRKKAVGAAPKAARPAKAPSDSPRSSLSKSSTEKLVCRYCGSDDLAPSFVKRRDARCRACFKKRYASARQDRKTAKTGRTKAAK